MCRLFLFSKKYVFFHPQTPGVPLEAKSCVSSSGANGMKRHVSGAAFQGNAIRRFMPEIRGINPWIWFELKNFPRMNKMMIKTMVHDSHTRSFM